MKNLLLLALVFIGINTYAQESNLPQLPQSQLRPELRDLRFGRPNFYQPLLGRIIIFRGHYYEPLNARVIIQRFPSSRVNNTTTCKKCIKQHRKHGINHLQSKRKNSRTHRPSRFR